MARQSAIGRSGLESVLVTGLTILLLGLVLLPILMVIVMSFTSAATLQFPPPGFSLRWYEEVFAMVSRGADSSSRLAESLQVSLLIATLTSVVCLVTGVPASYALVRYQFPARALVEELQGLPIVFPAVVLGITLLVIVSISGIDFGLWQIVVAHAIIGQPFMVRNCIAALKGVDPTLEEAARTLGASGLRTFVEVILPLMRGGIVSGILLVFILSFNEFTLSYFLYTVDVFPLSIWLYQQADTSFSPAIFAISSLIVLLNVLVIMLVDTLIGHRAPT